MAVARRLEGKSIDVCVIETEEGGALFVAVEVNKVVLNERTNVFFSQLVYP